MVNPETPEERRQRIQREQTNKTKITLKKDVAKINAVATALGGVIDPAKEISEFKEFCENVEDGWVDWTVEPDDLPYERPRSVRPRITNLTPNTVKDPG